MAKQKYTIMVNHDEYVEGVFDTYAQAYNQLEATLKGRCSDADIAQAKADKALDELADGYGYRIMDLFLQEPDGKHTLKLVNISVPTNYGTHIESRFLGDDNDIEKHKLLIGETINFGEYEGKHSEVEGAFSESDMTITPLTEDAAQAILNNVGKHIAGENLFDYYEVYEHYFEPFFVIRENLDQLLSESARAVLDDALNQKTYVTKTNGSFSAYSYITALEDLLPLRGLIDWSERLEDDYEEVATDLPEDIQKELTEWLDGALL